jgi:hypothetical protein
MKKLLLVTLLVIQFSKSEAQSWVYHPFPTDSAMWSNRFGIIDYGPMPGCCSTTVAWDPPVHYCMNSEDTVIGPNTYSKIKYCGGAYKGALRDAGGKIYFIPADSASEHLLYDFTVNTGDTVTAYINQAGWSGNWGSTTYHVGNVDSVIIAGTFRKRIQLEQGYWIEGIGNTMGLFMENWPNVSNYTIELICMSEGLATLYPSYSIGPCNLAAGIAEADQEEEIAMYPNPTGGLLQITATQSISRVEVMDILGNILISKNNAGNNSCELDLSGLAADIYFVRMEDAKGNYYVKKIVKQ